MKTSIIIYWCSKADLSRALRVQEKYCSFFYFQLRLARPVLTFTQFVNENVSEIVRQQISSLSG